MSGDATEPTASEADYARLFPPEWRNGLADHVILIGDIVDFSKAPAIEQRQIVESIWRFLSAHRLIKDVATASVNGTGDGALVAFDQLTFVDAICLALEWVDYMGRQKPAAGLRVAIHTGRFQRIPVPGHDDQVAGVGPNECARLSSIGDGGDIVVSERFVSQWAEECGRSPASGGVFRYLYPKYEPIELVVKHGVSQSIRLLSLDAVRRVPKKIARLDLVARLLKEQVLVDIHDDFLLGLCEHDRALRALNTPKSARKLIERISARVSLLAEDPDRPGELSSNGYRFHEASAATIKGRVTYSIHPKSPTGPAGLAYVRREPVVIHRLPDDADDPTGKYVAQLAKYGLGWDAISIMQRRPRACVCIPFGLHLQSMPPDGVICIDCESPLDRINKRQLTEIATVLSESYGLLVASLWNLRI